MRQFFLLICVWCFSLNAAPNDLPTAYQGRIRPLEAYTRLWLQDLYHAQTLRRTDLAAFQTDSNEALDLAWNMHIFGHTPWDDAPLFWVQHSETKKRLGLPQRESRFSYNAVQQAFGNSSDVATLLVARHFADAYRAPANRSGATRLELTTLSPGLWVALNGGELFVVQVPEGQLWHNLKSGDRIGSLSEAENTDKTITDDLMALWNSLKAYENLSPSDTSALNVSVANAAASMATRGASPAEIAETIERQLPLRQRLLNAGSDFKMLPGRLVKNEWYSLKALNLEVYDPSTQTLVPIGNFTIYPDTLFSRIREDYQMHNLDALAVDLTTAYRTLQGEPYQQAAGKGIFYPTYSQLAAESWYYQTPLTLIALGVYAVAATLLGLALTLHLKSLQVIGLTIMVLAWAIHTAILGVRIYILARPPVSNMFETVVYVPWIAVTLSFVFLYFNRTIFISWAASLVAVILLTLLEVTQLNAGMETVQPVLDSQYWLIIHVLLVVGSYGVFILCGLLGHVYLLLRAWRHEEFPAVSKAILHTMYLGTGMLIAGTILGGVWAAQSWGRFWDWDPKESWAFITSCVYLIWIHAYTFNYIRAIGLAAGSIVGLWAISFTWYGVNYILGTGLHSYGFGSGGEGYYYAFLMGELLFVIGCLLCTRKGKQTVILSQRD